jgi:hypothetical protein
MTKLIQQEEEALIEYLHTQTELLNISLLFLDAGIRPPQKLIDVGLSFAARAGFTEEEVTDLKEQFLKLPVKAITIEGTA